ncbi:MAG: signal peptide peptidase SppA [Bryobacteraceae bacterium]
MTKFLVGLLTGVLLTVLTAAIAIFSLARFGGEKRPPSVASNSVLMLQLEGEIPERAPVEFPLPIFEQQASSTVHDIWDILRKAAADSRIKAVVIQPRDLAVGWAKLQEIRGELEQFRKSGKPLVAYLKTPGMREYYLATAADSIFIGPEEMLDMKGLRAELMFLRKTLDKIGVQVEIEHAGKYKDFGDTFTRESMSPETREVLNSVLDDIYGHVLATIGGARRKSAEQVRAILDQGPFLAKQARTHGLVDRLIYEDEMLADLKKRLNTNDLPKISHRDYARIPAGSLDLEGKSRIAMVVAEGAITRGSTTGDGEDGIEAESFNKLLDKVAKDDSIKAVVVRIDSPGGESFASDEIWRRMNLLSKKKPTVISMSDLAASGGYYMALTGDPILAYPATFTGSIGVVFGKATLRGLYEKLGISKDLLTRGRFADIDSDYKPLTPEARVKLREGIDSTYQSFVSRVAEARKRKYEEVEPLAQGRVWLGSQAKQRGLVDELGGLDRAIELVKEKAKIPKDDKGVIVMYPPKRSVFDLLFSRSPEATLESRLGSIVNLKASIIRLWTTGGLMRIMPYQVDVR